VIRRQKRGAPASYLHATGTPALTGKAGNCGSGGGGAAKAGTTRDDTNAGAGLGCIAVGAVRLTNRNAEAGSCKGAGGGNDPGACAGGSGSDEGGSGGGDADDGSGSTSDSAGSASPGGSGGSGPGGGGQGSGPCGGFTQLAGLAGPGSVPVWMLVLGALGAFVSGVFFARRRSPSPLG
jgi:hypothetical protein